MSDCLDCTPCENPYADTQCKDSLPIKCITNDVLAIQSVNILITDNLEEIIKKLATAIASISNNSGGSGSAGTLQATVTLGNTSTKDIEITDFNRGIILKSPNNSRWRITIGNDGALISTAL